MNLRKLKNQAGFTLVELIVVIAIMAILAGVAVPVYSGYIEKAEKAGDLQLLGAVNSAFGAAVIENGSAPQELTGASITLTGETGAKTISGVSASAANADLSKVDESFDRYFAGNEASAFKVITQLAFDEANGVFVDLATFDGDVKLPYAGGYITISATDAQNLANSTYGTEIGAQGLLDKVNDVSGFASALDGSASYNAVITDPEFMKALLIKGGVMTEEQVNALDQEELLGTYGAVIDVLAQQQVDAGIAADLATAQSQVKANLAVLHAAQNTATMESTTINSLLTSSNPKQDILNALNNNPGEGLSQAALFYGMYTSFANTEKYGTDDRKAATDNPVTLINGLDEDELKDFKEYVNSTQGQADLNAYLSSMDMVNSGVANPEAVQNVLVNGYNNQELVDLLAGVMGN